MDQKEYEHFLTDFYEKVLHRIPDDILTLELLGSLYTDLGRIEEGLDTDKRIVRLKPKDPLAHYNLACSFALQGDTHASLITLKKAIKLGYDDFKWMAADKDLKNLHGNPQFKALFE